MPEIANFLASKCVEQDPTCDYAECRVPKPKLLRICIFDLQSTAKLSFVCLFPLPLLRCLSPWLSFSFLFFRFSQHLPLLWLLKLIMNIELNNSKYNSKQKRHNRAQSTFIYTKSKVKFGETHYCFLAHTRGTKSKEYLSRYHI